MEHLAGYRKPLSGRPNTFLQQHEPTTADSWQTTSNTSSLLSSLASPLAEALPRHVLQPQEHQSTPHHTHWPHFAVDAFPRPSKITSANPSAAFHELRDTSLRRLPSQQHVMSDKEIPHGNVADHSRHHDPLSAPIHEDTENVQNLGSIVDDIMKQYAYLWKQPDDGKQPHNGEQPYVEVGQSSRLAPQDPSPGRSHVTSDIIHLPGSDPAQYRSTQWLHGSTTSANSDHQTSSSIASPEEVDNSFTVIPVGYARSIYGARTQRLQMRYEAMSELLDPEKDWESATMAKVLASLLDTIRYDEEQKGKEGEHAD